MKITALVLAAGQGTRMRSTLAKVLHPLLGRPLVFYSLDAAQHVCDGKPVLVVGHEADAVQKVVGEAADFVLQEPQLGTGHAVMQAEAILRNKTEFLLVTYADMPLITHDTLQRVVQAHKDRQVQVGQFNPITILTVQSDDPMGFGRIIRSSDGSVTAIIEDIQATPEQRLLRELNTGVYCFDAEWLWESSPRLPLSPKGEYYLTDLVGIAVADGLSVQTVMAEDANEMIGINTRIHLAQATAIMRQRINQSWMLAGVTLVDPTTTYIESDVVIGRDTVILPNTHLLGKTRVGEDCTIGPNTVIRNTRLGDNCKVFVSVLEEALVEDKVDIGPFAHLRKGAHLAERVHMGNFGEVKNSYLGAGSKIGHFSYIGDATIGENVNIGAGTVTCNYDGKRKLHTEIEDESFIGSDTMLVAPVKLGKRARTGAGSVVTKDVPSDTLVVGMPARAIRKKNKSE